MARVMAVKLRDAAREAMLRAGGRGFMRFAPEGALMLTDAMRRCADEAAQTRLTDALEEAGFACEARDGLLLLTPRDDMLRALAKDAPGEIDWNDPLHPAMALAARFAAAGDAPLTENGRALVLDALRQTWQGEMDLTALRARAAVMLRSGDRSGFAAAGAVLWDYCDAMKGERV